MSPSVSRAPRILLRFEGFALFALATAGYAFTGLPWWLYAVLFFTPDVSLAAYGVGPKAGAAAYNAAHTTVLPAALAALGLMLDSTALLGLAAIFAAHIGFDRMLGFGLKYATAFSDTHLGRIGRASAAS